MESIFERYTKEVCSICKNKDCDEELRIRIDGSLKCEGYERGEKDEIFKHLLFQKNK